MRALRRVSRTSPGVCRRRRFSIGDNVAGRQNYRATDVLAEPDGVADAEGGADGLGGTGLVPPLITLPTACRWICTEVRPSPPTVTSSYAMSLCVLVSK